MKVLQLANALTEKWRLLQQTRRKMDELEGLVDEATLNLRRTNAMLEAEMPNAHGGRNASPCSRRLLEF